MALKNSMASVSLGNVEKERKKYGLKCCAAAKCNNQRDNRPDLSFHAFPKDLKTRKEWELRMRRGDVYFESVEYTFYLAFAYIQRSHEIASHVTSSSVRVSILG